MTDWDKEDGWAGGAEALSQANATLTNKPTPRAKSWDEQMDAYQPPKHKADWNETKEHD